MKNITIKKLPDSVYDRLKKSAGKHRRSLNKEVIYRLERSLMERESPEEILARADRIRERMAGRVFLTDDDIRRARESGRP